MPITTVVLNVTDVARSVDFYTTHLHAKLLGAATEEGATLDVLTATLELVAAGPQAPASTWVPDDLQRGFRHVGFKVDRVDPYVERLKDAGVQFQLEPIEAEGGVRITFFRDPDGTLLELVERDLQYTRVLDEAGVAAERAQGVPERPRFDHVALTVHDLHATRASYAPFGFTPIGAIAQPHDPRGFDIHYLKSGDTVLEVFTYRADKTERAPQLDAPGYVAAVLATGGQGQAGPEAVASPGLRPVGAVGGRTVHADADGFTTVLGG